MHSPDLSERLVADEREIIARADVALERAALPRMSCRVFRQDSELFLLSTSGAR